MKFMAKTYVMVWRFVYCISDVHKKRGFLIVCLNVWPFQQPCHYPLKQLRLDETFSPCGDI